jgi:hypothetical protein
MDVARIKDGRIELPTSLTDWFGDLTELSFFVEGDTLIFKKLWPPRLSDIAGQADENEMSMDEIVAEVHRYRQEKRDADNRI